MDEAKPDAEAVVKLEALSLEQRKQVDQWLFEEELTQAEVKARVSQEFKLELTQKALGDYYQKTFSRETSKALSGAGMRPTAH